MKLLENAIYKIEAKSKDGTEEEIGTGFFISSNLLLTSKHVISKYDENIIISNFLSKEQHKVHLIALCNICDMAILSITDGFVSNHYLSLCKSEIIEGEKWKTFGYPNNKESLEIGNILNGTIKRYIPVSTIPQDVNLDVVPFITKGNYSGFSGSPVINKYGDVISVIKYQTELHISAVSIKKAEEFLSKNKIGIKPDQLESFEHYFQDAFTGFENLKKICEAEARTAIDKLSPQNILDIKKGELFYPAKKLDIGEIITFLRNTKNINDHIWKGWIQLLSFIEIIKGNYCDVNHIEIILSSIEVKKMFGVIPNKRNIEKRVKLNFFFTEEESYLDIVKQFLHCELKNSKNQKDSCNIFNSTGESFGVKPIKVTDIIPNISCPENAGPRIPKVSIGILSLKQLRDSVIISETLDEATLKLKKLLEDAIN